MTLYDFSASYTTNPFVMPMPYTSTFQTPSLALPSFSSYPSIFGNTFTTPSTNINSTFSFVPSFGSYYSGGTSSSYGLFSMPPLFTLPAFNPRLNFGFLSGSGQRSKTSSTNRSTATFGSALTSGIWTPPTLSTSTSKKITGKNPTVSRALELALAELGTRENGRSNDSARIRKYKNGAQNNLPWCASFISWVYGAGQGSSNTKTFGYSMKSQTIRRRAQKAGFYSSVNSGYTPKPGDLMILKYSDDSGHIGIVSKVNSDGTFETIEGNSSDRVRRVHRSKSTANLHGFIRMNDWLNAA